MAFTVAKETKSDGLVTPTVRYTKPVSPYLNLSDSNYDTDFKLTLYLDSPVDISVQSAGEML